MTLDHEITRVGDFLEVVRLILETPRFEAYAIAKRGYFGTSKPHRQQYLSAEDIEKFARLR